LERLDRCLVNKDWESLFPTIFIQKLPREISDHNPLILSPASNPPQRKIPFRFETSWLKQPDFMEKVKNLWELPCHAESAMDRIQSKLKRFKQYFKGWGFNIQGENRRMRAELQEELLCIEQMEEESLLPLSMLNRKVEIQSKILKLLGDEELYWLKRSHETWLHEGDNNTEYFHRVANGRKRKNNIISFKKDDEIIEGTPNLISHATEYYKELFGPAIGNQFQLDSDLWGENELVSEDDNILLTKSFSEEEIKYALFQMEKNKAAGPDSIPIEFFQGCWEIVRKDIL